MKFKKEYRWLMFLLLPFIVFMLVLFMVPLEFVLNAQPLATQNYNAQKTELEQIPVRAAVIAHTHKLNNQLTAFSKLANLFFEAQKTMRFVAIDVGKINMFNAQNYYQNHLSSLNGRDFVSMWFASKAAVSSDLSTLQLAAYNQYTLFQPYLRSYFSSGGGTQGLVGTFMFCKCATDGDLVFHFPSYSDLAYKEADSVVDFSLYDSAVANYAKSKSTIVTVVDYSKSLIDGPLMLICQLILSATKSDPAKGLFCLKLDLSLLSKGFLNDLINQAPVNEAYDFLSLMSPILNENIGSQILTNISFVSKPIQPVFPVNQTIKLGDLSSKKVFMSESLVSLQEGQNFNVYRFGDQIYYILPIYLLNLQTNSYSPALYVLMHNNFKVLGVELEFSNINSNTLNTLLIPTIVLILLSALISIFVLRSLLNGLDQELFKLNDRCKFIVDGDIEIDIPEFKGAKDIADVYEEVRIINKLHRYTSKEYFVGHFSNKILKYNQALQVIRKLKYDPSHLMEGIGEAYLFIQQYDKSLFFLKQSVRILESKMQQEFGNLDTMLHMKQQKQKIPMAYREMEIIMIRRLWKLIFTYFKYVDLQVINSKSLEDEVMGEKEKQLKKERLQRETAQYITKMKKALYPDYKSYAECVMLLCFQINMYLNIKNLQAARDCLGRCNKITQLYTKEYDENTKKLKEKGSKNLFFFKKNKLTGHSRASPNIMEAFNSYIRALVMIQDPKSRDYNAAAILLFEALKKNIASQSVNYLIFNELKKLFTTLKIPMDKISTMQLFHQSMPYKTLYFGPLTKEAEAGLYKIAKSPIEVESREFVFYLDSSQIYVSEQLLTSQTQYILERSSYLFDKLIKKFDRVSLAQSNSQTGFLTHCSLTLKESNETILKKSLTDMMKGLSYSGKNELIYSLETIIFRVKKLQCQKVVLFFLKHMDSYSDERIFQTRSKSKTKHKRKTEETRRELLTDREHTVAMDDIGEGIENLMVNSQTRNIKLILICAEGDEYSKVVNTFGLKDINKRIWSRTQNLNKNNNLVYIIDDKHKSDFDRILMSKLANVPDNHVFAL